MQSRRILALEPFYGGSHKAFLDGWIAHSQHHFTVFSLPPYKWKWRMRHSAVTFGSLLQEATNTAHEFDLVWCSDMLNLAEFLGLAPEPIRILPRVAYFHENQLTYPVRVERDRDLHFAYSNFTTCLAADQVWFNSAYHQNEFTSVLAAYLRRMPDYQAADSVKHIVAKSSVQYPGIEETENALVRSEGPIRIVWNARWEHDKNPDDFFTAMRELRASGFPFQLIVLGETFSNIPAVFTTAREEFADQILHWGYVEDTAEYHQLLTQADVVVSTANHEFFGIGIVEAMAAGAVPLVPGRLAYPEVLSQCKLPIAEDQLIYGQTADELANAIRTLAQQLGGSEMRKMMSQAITPFLWNTRAQQMDSLVTALTDDD